MLPERLTPIAAPRMVQLKKTPVATEACGAGTACIISFGQVLLMMPAATPMQTSAKNSVASDELCFSASNNMQLAAANAVPNSKACLGGTRWPIFPLIMEHMAMAAVMLSKMSPVFKLE